MKEKKFPLLYLLLILVTLLVLIGAPSQFFARENVSLLLHRTATITLLVCGFSFLLTLGRIDFSAGFMILFLTSLLRVADSEWKLSPFLMIAFAVGLTLVVALWHFYWIDRRNIPASFITGITSVFFWTITLALPPLAEAIPHSLFFYVLAFNPLSNIAIYTLIVSLLFAFFVLYYLRLSSRLQYNLSTDQWIPFMILVLTGSTLGLTGFIRLHEFIQFRLSFFIALLTLLTFFILERYSRLGRRIHTIGSDPEIAYLAGIPVDKVRRTVWILMGILVAITSLFFHSDNAILDPIEATRLQSILLAGSLMGTLSENARRVRIFQSSLAVALLVIIESLVNLWSHSPSVMTLIAAVLIFVSLSTSRFRLGQLT